MPDNLALLQPDFQVSSNPVSGAFVDWLSVTLRIKPLLDVNTDSPGPWFFQFFQHHFSQLLDIPRRSFSVSDKGWMGYEARILFGESGCYGFVAFGGQSQRNTVSIQLTGACCRRVSSWSAFSHFCARYEGKITRVDLAYDDFNSEHYTLAECVQLFRDGAFVSANATPSSGRLVDDLGSGAGSTLYIGNRSSGKLCRIYEKGKQLGDKNSRWIRYEVEYRSKNREIGWDVLAFPGDYLSGAYRPFSVLSASQSVIKTTRRIKKISLVRAQQWLKHSAGATINALLMHMYDGDVSKLVFDAIRLTVPRRLSLDLC